MGLQCRSISFEGKTFQHYYLCHYRPIRAGADALSQSLVRFKQGLKLHVDAWSACAVQELVKKGLGTSGIIVHARRSVESRLLHLEDSPLALLCKTLAQSGTGVYESRLLVKTRATVSLKGLSLKERELEMKNVYQVNAENTSRRGDILLIDDIYTSGATIRFILRALLSIGHKRRVNIFTLAYTDYGNDSSQVSTLMSDNYQFMPEFGWSTVAEDQVDTFTITALNRMIEQDYFE